jgi:hypothetical protein
LSTAQYTKEASCSAGKTALLEKIEISMCLIWGSANLLHTRYLHELFEFEHPAAADGGGRGHGGRVNGDGVRQQFQVPDSGVTVCPKLRRVKKITSTKLSSKRFESFAQQRSLF